MLLAVDIGNTNITIGIFDKELLIRTIRWESDISLTINEYALRLRALLKDYVIDSCAIVSVVDELTQVFKSACDKIFGVNSFIFSSSVSGMKIALNEPEKIGTDRLVNAYAVMNKYPLPAIVVDIGTAITLDIVSKDKVFLGGIIMPGINLQFEALHRHTSKLPFVTGCVSEKSIGDNTVNAMLSGVIRGSACAIEGLIRQCESELNARAVIIAAGGQCSVLSGYMTRKFDYINPDLTLEGLQSAYLNSHVNLY